MPYPTKYTRQYDFQSYQVSNPTRPLPGNQVNIDLNAVKQSVGEIVDFLKTSIRSDGKLANGSVGVNQLDATFELGFSLPTVWEPGVGYTIDSTVLYQNKFWHAKIAHTSTDGFDESKWDEIVDFGAQATAAAASATAALASETNAATSETNAAASESSVAANAAAAAVSETNAAASEANAAASEANASASATSASASASAAAVSETNAAASAGMPNRVFDTQDAAVAARPVVLPEVIMTGGYTDIGDGGDLLFVQAASEPADQPKMLMTPYIGDPIWYKGATETLNIKQFGAKGDGSYDNYQKLLDAASLGRHVVIGEGVFGTSAAIPMASNTWFQGRGQKISKIIAATAGQHLFQGVNVSNLRLSGLGLEGVNSSTAPTTNVDSLGSDITGLVTFSRCFDTKVEDCEISKFYYGISANKSERHWVERNHIHNWYVIGSMASRMRQWSMTRNVFKDCDQNGANVSYAGMATGSDDTYLNYCIGGVFAFNHVENVPSWDGFMSHGGRNMRLIGNRFKGVRCGIDMSHYDTLEGVVIVGNDIESTTTDVWAGSGALHGGIRFSSDVGQRQPTTRDCVIANNTMRGFYSVSGMVAADSACVMSLRDIDRALVTGNTIMDVSGAVTCAGIALLGTCGKVVLGNNILDGTFASGGIRTVSATVTDLIVGDNAIVQGTASDIGVYVDSGSTVSRFALGNNTTNSTTPFLNSGTITTYSGPGHPIHATASYAGGTFANNTSSGTGSLTVSGAALGDRVTSSFSVDLQGVALLAWVSAANTVSYKFINNTGGSITIAAGTLRVSVIKGA